MSSPPTSSPSPPPPPSTGPDDLSNSLADLSTLATTISPSFTSYNVDELFENSITALDSLNLELNGDDNDYDYSTGSPNASGVGVKFEEFEDAASDDASDDDNMEEEEGALGSVLKNLKDEVRLKSSQEYNVVRF